MAKNKGTNATNNRAAAAYKGIFGSLRILMHLVAAVQFSYAIYYDSKYVHFPDNANNMNIHFGGKFRFLTFLDAIIQAIYYTLSLINDFFGSNEVAPKKVPMIRKLKDFIMATFAFPIALNVAISFWALYAIDRELVFPRALDAVFPSWLNHVMHTNIVVFIVLEMFISFRAYPNRSKGLLGLTTFMVLYLVWLHVIKHFSGAWVYPVLEVLSFPQRTVFFVVSLAFTIGMYMFGEIMNNVVWSKELKMAQRKIK